MWHKVSYVGIKFLMEPGTKWLLMLLGKNIFFLASLSLPYTDKLRMFILIELIRDNL